MQHFLFLAGPPCGTHLWSHVLDRIRSQGHNATAIDVQDLGEKLNGGSDWAGALGQIMAELEPCVLVAHGTAVPLACHAAVHHPPDGLVLSNGPLGPLNPGARALARTLRTLGATATLKWLSSPAGLRRTVVNPYVWDHDTVVTVCGPLFEDHDTRTRIRRFIAQLPKTIESAPPPNVLNNNIYRTNITS